MQIYAFFLTLPNKIYPIWLYLRIFNRHLKMEPSRPPGGRREPGETRPKMPVFFASVAFFGFRRTIWRLIGENRFWGKKSGCSGLSWLSLRNFSGLEASEGQASSLGEPFTLQICPQHQELRISVSQKLSVPGCRPTHSSSGIPFGHTLRHPEDRLFQIFLHLQICPLTPVTVRTHLVI